MTWLWLQDGETNDRPAVAWNKGEKPMMEVPAGSDVWWYVEVVQAAPDELRVAYPGACCALTPFQGFGDFLSGRKEFEGGSWGV